MKKLLIAIAALTLSTVFTTNTFAMSQPQGNKVAKVAKINQIKKVNLNTAGAKEIADTLKGVGTKKAEAIVAYRKKHGDFNKIEDLAAVKGIGVVTIAKNESVIVLK